MHRACKNIESSPWCYEAGKESPNSVSLKVKASVGAAAMVLDSEEGEVLRAATEGLNFGVTMYPQVLHLLLVC